MPSLSDAATLFRLHHRVCGLAVPQDVDRFLLSQGPSLEDPFV